MKTVNIKEYFDLICKISKYLPIDYHDWVKYYSNFQNALTSNNEELDYTKIAIALTDAKVICIDDKEKNHLKSCQDNLRSQVEEFINNKITR